MKAPEEMDRDLETRLRVAGRHFPYPPTPDIAGSVAGLTIRQPPRLRKPGFAMRSLAVVLLLVLALCAGVFAVPTGRAAILRFLQLGGIRIFLEPTPTLVPEGFSPFSPATATPLPSFLSLAGETTLGEARAELPFPVPLPTYPLDLGEPDRVYLQDLSGPAALLVWLEPGGQGAIRLSLMVLGPGASAGKSAPLTLAYTAVNGAEAFWLEGNHLLFLEAPGGAYAETRLSVRGNVLVWEREGITYRLESDLPLLEARRIAESIP